MYLENASLLFHCANEDLLCGKDNLISLIPWNLKQENCCHNYGHCYLQTNSWVFCFLLSGNEFKNNIKNIKQINKKHIPYIQGNGTLLGKQLFLEKNS